MAQHKAVEVGSVYASDEQAAFTCCVAGVKSGVTLLLAGRDDGYIILLEMSGGPQDPRASYSLQPGWEKDCLDMKPKLGRLIPKTSAQMGKKPITHLALDAELMRLFAVCDGVVSMCSVDVERKTVRQISNVVEDKKVVLKGVTSICCGVVRGKHVLFAAVKRKIFLFRFTSEAVSPLVDNEICNNAGFLAVDSQAQVVSMSLMESLLCVCTKDEYKMVDLAQGSTSVIERKGRGTSLAEACINTQKQRHMLFLQFGKKTSVITGEGTLQYRGSDDLQPLVQWGDIPNRIFWLQPFYLISIASDKLGYYTLLDRDEVKVVSDREDFKVPKSVPVYLGEANNLARQILPPNASNTSRCLFLCSNNTIYVVAPVPFVRQLTQLAKEGSPGSVATALAILQSTHEDADFSLVGQQIKCHIHKEAGFANFDGGRWEEAFWHFLKCHEVDPEYLDAREILTLFGLHGPLRKYMKQENIASNRRNMRDVVAHLSVTEKKAQMDAAKMSLYRYLENVRVLYPDPEKAVSHVHRAIDTAMLLLYLELFKENTPDADAALFEIMKDGNVLEYETCAAELESRKKLRCLALLKVHNGLVADALQMLYELGSGRTADTADTAEESTNAGVAETVLALQHCHGEESGLVLEYLPWVLSKDPRAVSALLVPRDPPLEPAKVMTILAPYPDDVVMQYLEFLIDEQQSTDPKHHTRLALIYVEFIQKLMKTCPTVSGIKAGREAGLLGALRRKLARLLTKVPSYSSMKPYHDPIKVISHVHGSPMLEELVILYSYTEEHEAALRVLLYEQKDEEGAVNYCKDQYKKAMKKHLISVFGARIEDVEKYKRAGLFNASVRKVSLGDSSNELPVEDTQEEDEEDETKISLDEAVARPEEFFAMYTKKLPVGDKHGNVFTGIHRHNTYLFELVKQCLYPGTGKAGARKENPDFAMQLLSEHGRNLNPMLVFKLLPDDTDVELIHSYLLKAFRQTTSTLKEIKIHKQLAASNLHKHEVDRATLLDRSVLVEYERLCDVCGKRLGNGHLKCMPDLQVVHYQCIKGNAHLSPKTSTPYWSDMHRLRDRS